MPEVELCGVGGEAQLADEITCDGIKGSFAGGNDAGTLVRQLCASYSVCVDLDRGYGIGGQGSGNDGASSEVDLGAWDGAVSQQGRAKADKVGDGDLLGFTGADVRNGQLVAGGYVGAS